MNEAESVSLRDASVQDIQLELLRRTSFNALDGEKVHATLLKHQDLWLAALLDKPGVPNYSEPGHLTISGLIKLRDLADNTWNADTLFILTLDTSGGRPIGRDGRGGGVGRRGSSLQGPGGDRPGPGYGPAGIRLALCLVGLKHRRSGPLRHSR